MGNAQTRRGEGGGGGLRGWGESHPQRTPEHRKQREDCRFGK